MNSQSASSLRQQSPESLAWALLTAVSNVVRHQTSGALCSVLIDAENDEPVVIDRLHEQALLSIDTDGGWRCHPELPEQSVDFIELYMPVLGTRNHGCSITAHLGQSVDAKIATIDGDAFYVTGEENRKHLHRLRALCDAVIVGASTVAVDNPQLTTRAVTGNHPVRVIVDPDCRLSENLGVFSDCQAPTLILHAEHPEASMPDSPVGNHGVERIFVPTGESAGKIAVADIVHTLQQRGLKRLFIEGGGVTVTNFVNAGFVDHLQLAVAPVLVGEGRSSLTLPGSGSMEEARRPQFQLYRMGEDVLWDFDLTIFEHCLGSKLMSINLINMYS